MLQISRTSSAGHWRCRSGNARLSSHLWGWDSKLLLHSDKCNNPNLFLGMDLLKTWNTEGPTVKIFKCHKKIYKILRDIDTDQHTELRGQHFCLTKMQKLYCFTNYTSAPLKHKHSLCQLLNCHTKSPSSINNIIKIRCWCRNVRVLCDYFKDGRLPLEGKGDKRRRKDLALWPREYLLYQQFNQPDKMKLI